MELYSTTLYSRRTLAAALVVLVFLGTTFSVSSAQTIWKRSTLPQGAPLQGISIPSDGNAFAVGWHGRILRSTDDGATWSDVSAGLPADSNNDLSGISFGSPLVGIAVGSGGTIISTGDGGVTWTKRFSEMEYDLDKPMMVGARNGFFHSPLFAVSRDGGATWSFLTQISDFSMNAFWMFDSLNGVAAAWTSPDSYHRMVRTTNAGASWQPTAFSLWQSHDFFEAIAFGSTALLWAIRG